MKKTVLVLTFFLGVVSLSFGQSNGNISDDDPNNELQQLGILRDTLFLSQNGGAIPLSDFRLSLPFEEEIDLPNQIAFGVANTNTGNVLAISGRQGAGSSRGPVGSAAIFGTSEQGSGVVGFSSGNGNFAGVLGSSDSPGGTGVIGRAEGPGIGGLFESSGRSALVTGHGNVGIGIQVPEAKLEVNGDMRVNADVGKFVLGYPQNGHQWAMTTTGKGANLIFGAKADGASVFDGRMALLQTGNVGIGNAKPDEKLVVGTNIGENWSVPAITVGDETGGFVQAGNTSYSISMGTTGGRDPAQIVVNSGSGPGTGLLELHTRGLSVGGSPGSAGNYAMKVVNKGLGLNLQRSGTDFNWEFYVAQNSGELRFYYNNILKGVFSPVDGFYTPSDRGLKSDIRPMGTVLRKIIQLVPSTYKFTNGNPDQKIAIGFIAQDVEKLFPEMVSVSSEERSLGIYSLNYATFGVLAIKAIQEQQALIEAQRIKSAGQQRVIEDLKSRLERLEALVKN